MRSERVSARNAVLITPTRDRPEAFQLCERWMRRQTQRWTNWIVVDDGDTPVVPTLGQIHYRREPSADACTLQRNLIAGLEIARELQPDVVLFIEDDDWYAADYVEAMSRELETAKIVGEMRRRYYHVPTRGYLSCYNRKHAALASTGIRALMIPHAIRSAERAFACGSPYVDLRLWEVGDEYRLEPRWKRIEEERMGRGRRLLAARKLSVGVKGVPGRSGLGTGHVGALYRAFDTSGRVLREWVGRDDAEAILALVPAPALCENRAR